MKMEIEVKAKIRDLELIKNKLVEMGCFLSEPVTQHDYIYTIKGLDINKGYNHSPVLRIREQKGKYIFTLKKNRSNELDCIEKELEISDRVTMQEIFELMGYESNVQVRKTRIKGNYEQYEICLDEVEGLGSYIEVEKISDEDGEKVQNELFDFLQTLGVKKEDRVFNGYDTLIWLKNNEK